MPDAGGGIPENCLPRLFHPVVKAIWNFEFIGCTANACPQHPLLGNVHL